MATYTIEEPKTKSRFEIEEPKGKSFEVIEPESKVKKGLDFVGRPSQAIKSGEKEKIAQRRKEKPVSIIEEFKAMGKGLHGEERTLTNELLGQFGIKGIPGLGLATEIAVDPLTFLGGGIAKTFGAGASKIGKTISQLPVSKKAYEIIEPGLIQTKKLFVNSTGITKLDELVNKYTMEREYLRGKSVEIGIKTRKQLDVIAKNSGRSVDDISQEIVNIVELPQEVKASTLEIQTLADNLKKQFSDLLTNEMKAGVPITKLSENVRGIEYFPRITTQEARVYLKQAKIGKARVWNPKIENALQRRTEDFTLGEFNEFVKANGLESLGGRSVEQFFMKNPAYAVAQRGLTSAKGVTSAKFIQEAGEVFGKSKESIPYGVELLESLQKTYPLLREKVFDPEVAEEIGRVYTTTFNQQEVNNFLKSFDKIQNYCKAWTLAPFPKYHIRNSVGNIWNNYLSGTVNPMVYGKAAALSTYKKTGSDIFLKPFGIKSNQADDIIDQAEQLTVLNQGWFGADIPETIESFVGKPSFNLLSEKGILIKSGRSIGKAVENNARLAHFIDKIEKGFSPDAAALSVKKFLFDYKDLTIFERQVLKRMMPFYTWSRKNIPLQIDQFIEQPQKFVPIMKILDNRKEEDLAKVKYTNPYMYEKLPAEYKRTIDSVTYIPLEGLLPSADLAKISRPQELFFELLSPYIKTPLELIMNKSFFTEKEIEKYPNETKELLGMDIPIKWHYAFTTILHQARMIKTINNAMRKKTYGEELSPDEIILEQSLSSIYKMNLDDLSLKANQVIDRKIRDLKQAYKWAIRNDRNKEAERILKTIDATMEELNKF